MTLEKAKQTIKDFHLLKKNDRIVVGVSGGPDSVTLLYLLHSLSRELNLKLIVAHLDHGLRKDSVLDKRFVENLAKKLKLPLEIARANLKPALMPASVEQAARNARFDFLFRAAKKNKAKKIALGHNLDDQAETVLMRILRGTGLSGLNAISPKRKIRGIEIIRPLLETRRKEIESFLCKKRLHVCRDFSNQQDLYLRNKLRNRLIPLLEEQYNHKIKEILSNLAQSTALDYEYLNLAAERFIRAHNAKIPLKDFQKLHPAIQRLVLRLAIARLKGDTRSINFTHILELEDLVSARPENSIVDLPKGVSALKNKGALYFFLK
ncbi:MAG: tRNA lysidine(34) synthetase TilS [Candidatus Omnitrophica bacterium]|nr:tRNA lysidine(34) synthetase TilS [Candidatus Omnitrophota bacterium]